MGVEGARDQVLAGRRPGVVGRGGGEGEPVPEVEARRPEVLRSGLAAHVLDPRLHARVLPLEQARVTVGEVQVPRDDRGGVGPGGRSPGELVRLAQHVGHHVGDAALLVLVGRDVGQPLGEEPGHVHVEARGVGEGLGVPGPPQPLVALRAVGRHVEEVALLPPLDVVLELVQQRVRGGELPGHRHVGVDDDAGQAVERRLAGPARDRHVAEALEGEVRLVPLFRPALEDVGHELLRRPQVGRVEVSGLVEHLGVAQGHRRPRGAAHLQPHVAHHVLAHVEDRLAGRRLEDLDRPDLLDPPDRRPRGGDESGRDRLSLDDRRPVGVRVARGAPARALQAGVVGLAVVDVRAADRPRRRLPRVVRPHGHDAAVRVLDPDLAPQGEAIAVDRAPVGPGEEAAVPAVAQGGADRVLAGAQLPRDVVGLVLEAVVVARPARREELVPHALPVDLQLVEAEARHVRARRLHGALHREGPAQHRRGLRRLRGHVAARLDEAGRPVLGLQEPHLPGRGSAPRRGLPRAVPHADAPGVPPGRLERLSPVRDVDGGRCGDPARVPDRLAVACDLHLVGRLDRAAPGRLQLPAQPRLRHVDPEGIDLVLAPQAGDRGRDGRRRGERRGPEADEGGGDERRSQGGDLAHGLPPRAAHRPVGAEPGQVDAGLCLGRRRPGWSGRIRTEPTRTRV